MSNAQIKQAYEHERDSVARSLGTSTDIDAVNETTREFYSRFDQSIDGISRHAKLNIDCKAGCNYCCHFRVDASANEIFTLVEYIRTAFSDTEFEALIERATTSRNTIQSLSQSHRIITNIPCPLLSDGECSAYEARPSMCRKMHSVDVSQCQHSFDKPDDRNVSNAEHPVLSAITMTMLTAARDGFKSRKLDESIFDLAEVLLLALQDSKYRKRWLNGKKAFV